ncbi:hypothetical protein ACFE04_019884 [Oxalis oulophora]
MDLAIHGNGLITRRSSIGCSSRIFYYNKSSEGVVPFIWEMEPGTPKDPPKYEPLPPLSPPPALLSIGLPTPNINYEEAPKLSFRKRLIMFLKHKKKKNQPIKVANENYYPRSIFNNNVHHFFEICSSEESEFMGSSSRSQDYSRTSSSSSTFSIGPFMKSSSSSRSQIKVKKDAVEIEYTCSPLSFSFTSVLGRVARLA